ncbi:MAG: epoxyqueuosine reductase [bacterium]|nr:epoxyqueuosine reductase [bacterium]
MKKEVSTKEKTFYQKLKIFALKKVDKIGFASINRFNKAPAGTRPTDQMPECKSVIVFALKHLDVFTTTQNLACQAYSQDITNQEVLHQAYRLSRFIEKNNFQAFPIVASVQMWPFVKKDNQTAIGRISLRHAAQLAGLGYIGRNAMLITHEFGPRVQLGAILTDAELSAPIEKIQQKNPCNACNICIKHCPADALHTPDASAQYIPVNKDKCLEFREFNGGQSPLGYPDACGLCRAACPIGRQK